MDFSHKKCFVASIAKKKPEYCALELAVITQLEKQQNNRFQDYSQYQISSKLQNTFVAGTHQQNFLLEPENYQCFDGYPFEKQFHKNMKEYKRKHYIQFRAWKTVNSHKA